MWAKIRNFYFADKEAPIFGIVTKSQLLTIWWFSILPGMWFFYNLQIWTSPFLTITSLIILMATIWLGFVASSFRIDWRSIWKYLIDKRRQKVTIKTQRKHIPSTDINKLIDSIKDEEEFVKEK